MGTPVNQQAHNRVVVAFDLPPTLTKISSLAENRLAEVLFYPLSLNGGGFDSAREGFAAL